MPYGVESPGAKRQPIWLPRSPVLSLGWARRTPCSGCRCSPCPFTRAVGVPSCGASSSLPSDCSRSFGDALARGPQQWPLPWELISQRRIGSRLLLPLPIPRLHLPALPATPLPGFLLPTLPASWLRSWLGRLPLPCFFVGSVTARDSGRPPEGGPEGR